MPCTSDHLKPMARLVCSLLPKPHHKEKSQAKNAETTRRCWQQEARFSGSPEACLRFSSAQKRRSFRCQLNLQGCPFASASPAGASGAWQTQAEWCSSEAVGQASACLKGQNQTAKPLQHVLRNEQRSAAGVKCPDQ